MDSNTHSTEVPGGLAAVVAELQQLAAQDPDRLTEAARAERVMAWRGLLDRQEGLWLGELAAVDARGAAGAEEGIQEGSTAGWLRRRLRMGAGAAATAVRTARALYRGPLTGTAQALVAGEISPAHAQVLAAGTQELPAHLAAEAEPALVAAARRLDPPRLRRLVAHLCLAADPEGADAQAERRHGRRGVWTAITWDGMVALQGLLEAEAGQTLTASWAATPAWAARAARAARWTLRPVGGWPATVRSPGSWSPATPPATTTTTTATTATMRAWPPCSGQR